jgi:hypothetical protein
MNPVKRSRLQERLSGIEFRNQQRQARRRLLLGQHLERKRVGTARKYESWIPQRRA